MPLIAAIAGDILGSSYEHHNFHGAPEELVFFQHGAGPTDDSVLTCAVAQALLEAKDSSGAIDAAHFERVIGVRLREFALRHTKIKGGYGSKFLRWLLTDNSPSLHSFGNGSAMRVSPCAWAAKTEEEALRLARLSAMPTHDHPLGILGAEATALAIWRFREGAVGREKLRAEWPERFGELGALPPKEDFALTKAPLRFRATCQATVPFTVALALDSASWEETVRRAVALGGDCDTSAAISGSIAAGYSAVPPDIREAALRLLPSDLRDVVEAFADAFPQ